MRNSWPLLVIMLVGCRADVYGGTDLQKVVTDGHTAFIEQQIASLKNGDAAEAIRLMGESASNPAKFVELRDKVQSVLETSLRAGGHVVSYKISEAEKTEVENERNGADKVSANIGNDTKPVTEARSLSHDCLTIRVEVKFEHGTGDFEYTFCLIDGIWKVSGGDFKFHAHYN